ncbi:MAG: hypothetical protein KME26_19105 [Oscillatoria princeps RMCB-10]|nr:hypothetical protein [Oscillatoria princeps RMCB-10]
MTHSRRSRQCLGVAIANRGMAEDCKSGDGWRLEIHTDKLSPACAGFFFPVPAGIAGDF